MAPPLNAVTLLKRCQKLEIQIEFANDAVRRLRRRHQQQHRHRLFVFLPWQWATGVSRCLVPSPSCSSPVAVLVSLSHVPSVGLGWVFQRRLPKSRRPQDHPKCVNVGIHGSSLSQTDPAISRRESPCRVYDISSFSKWDRPPAPLALLSSASLLLFYCYGDAVTRLFNFHSEAWLRSDPPCLPTELSAHKLP